MRNKNGIPKVETLGLLDGAGVVSTEDYAVILEKGGFPGDYFRAHRLLARFRTQGLVEQSEEQKTLRYRVKGHEEPVERRQRVVLWELTEKGVDRLKWLREHGSGASGASGASPRPRAGKSPKSGKR